MFKGFFTNHLQLCLDRRLCKSLKIHCIFQNYPSGNSVWLCSHCCWWVLVYRHHIVCQGGHQLCRYHQISSGNHNGIHRLKRIPNGNEWIPSWWPTTGNIIKCNMYRNHFVFAWAYQWLCLCYNIPWWRHQMETFPAVLALCAGNSPVPVNSPHKVQWRGALVFSLICARINDWVNNREGGV